MIQKLWSIFNNKKNIYFLLASIIFFDLLVFSFFIYDKDPSFCDEMWSYSSSNAPVSPFIEKNSPYLEKWLDGKEFFHIFTPSLENRFTYLRIVKNIDPDVHPPLYYSLLHSLSSLFYGSSSIWIPISINYLSFILIMIFLFKSMALLGSYKKALLICFIFSVSLASFCEVNFIRMYELLCAFSVMCIYYHIVLLTPVIQKQTPNKKIQRTSFIKIFELYFLGYFTHYSFIVFAFFTSCSTLILIYNKLKNIKLLIKYFIFSSVPFLLSFIFQIKSFKVLCGENSMDSGRILNNLLKDNWIEKLDTFWKILQIKIHINYLIAAGLVSLAVFLFKKIININFSCSENLKIITLKTKPMQKCFNLKFCIDVYKLNFFLYFAFIFISSYLFIIKTCYFPNIRYLWMILPVFYILIGLMVNSKFSCISLLIFTILAAGINIRSKNIEFLDKTLQSKAWLQENKIETILYYKEFSWLWFGPDASLLAVTPRAYVSQDINKHITTSSNKVAVIFSAQFFQTNGHLPYEIVETSKNSLGFNQATFLYKEKDRELWVFSKN